MLNIPCSGGRKVSYVLYYWGKIAESAPFPMYLLHIIQQCSKKGEYLIIGKRQVMLYSRIEIENFLLLFSLLIACKVKHSN